MRRTIQLAALIVALAAILWPSPVQAQRRRVVVRPAVFVGGYFYDPFFYDPFFGPYGWYPYPYPYAYPVAYARGASDVRVLVSPKDAQVYVDGYYAGVVDDFDGFFQRLTLPPGAHEFVLHLDGYRTVHQQVYLTPSSTYKLRYTMEKLAAGEASEPPPAAPVPPPETAPAPLPGSGPPPSQPPARSRPPLPPRRPAPADASAFGTLSIRVQPSDADVLIDGEPWRGSAGQERLLVQITEGTHHVEIQKDGYQRFSTDVQIRRGETTPLNVSLSLERPR